MANAWKNVSLGDVAALDIELVPVLPEKRYRVAGVLNAGQGMLSRASISGSETNYRALHKLRTGQLVMRKLTAWEGPITVVPHEFDGFVASPEFPTFTLDEAQILPDYMRLVCQRPELWNQMQDRATGTVQRRKRVNPSQLLQVTFALPPLSEQQRVVALIDDVDACLQRARETVEGVSALARSLRDSHFSSAQGTLVRAGDFFEITMGRQRSPKHAEGDHMIPYLRSANVKDGRLELEDVKAMNFTPTEQSKYALRDGDVLISEGCGSLDQLGAAAQWFGNGEVVCFQNTLLRLRERPEVSSSCYANQWARYEFESGGFAAIASGTNIFHIGAERAVEMPVRPTTLEDQASFVATVESADQMTTAARNEIAALVALRSALLEELLSGSRETQDRPSPVQELA